MTTSHIPIGMTSVTPYLIVEGAARLIEFTKLAFAANEISRQESPGRGIMHSLITIDGAAIEISDSSEEILGRPGTIHIYVEDVDATYQRAIEHGARSLYEPTDQFYGDREAGVEDPCGNYWFIARHDRDVTDEELRVAAFAEIAGAQDRDSVD